LSRGQDRGWAVRPYLDSAHEGILPEFALRGLVHASAAKSSRRHSLRSRRRCGLAALACTRPRTESPWSARSPVQSRLDGGVAGEPMSRMRRARPPHPRPSRTTTPARVWGGPVVCGGRGIAGVWRAGRAQSPGLFGGIVRSP
jgi:hypothetical protein